jgi:hypothetical protein
VDKMQLLIVKAGDTYRGYKSGWLFISGGEAWNGYRVLAKSRSRKVSTFVSYLGGPSLNSWPREGLTADLTGMLQFSSVRRAKCRVRTYS